MAAVLKITKWNQLAVIWGKEIILKNKIILLTKKSLIILLNCINKQLTLKEHPLKRHMTALATQKLEEFQH